MRGYRLLLYLFAHFALLTFASFSASAQTQLSPKLRQKIDKLANESLAKSGVSAQHTHAADAAPLALCGAADAGRSTKGERQ